MFDVVKREKKTVSKHFYFSARGKLWCSMTSQDLKEKYAVLLLHYFTNVVLQTREGLPSSSNKSVGVKAKKFEKIYSQVKSTC